MTLRLPKRFYKDHVWRDLPTPAIIRETARHYFIDTEDIAKLAELYSDAQFYADYSMIAEVGCRSHIGLVSSAAATVRAIEKFAQESPGHQIEDRGRDQFGLKISNRLIEKQEDNR